MTSLCMFLIGLGGRWREGRERAGDWLGTYETG